MKGWQKGIFTFILITLVFTSLAGCQTSQPSTHTKTTHAETTHTETTPTTTALREQTSETSSTQPSIDITSTYDTSECQDYQLAYVEFLKEVRAADAGKEEYERSDSYSIYDIDKNGVPELLIQYSNCEAGYYTVIYTYKAGKVVTLCEFFSGHMSLFSWPGENGIMLFEGQMGCENVTRAVLVDGKLTEEVLSQKDETVEYSDPNSFIKGARYIDMYDTHISLPIYRCNDKKAPVGSASFQENAVVRNAFHDVLLNNQKFYTDCIYGFIDDTMLLSMETFLSANTINQYSDNNFSILEYSYLDMNGDQQAELLLHLSNSIDEDVLAVMSYDDGLVYCYYIPHAEIDHLMQNGLIIGDNETFSPEAIAFYKSESYTYIVDSKYASGVPSVIWIDFSQYE